ncbi:FecR family protein [Nitrosomonas marina]|uniref:Transmembrane sensor n=1 Tax=Nitrosomonas marina TaxID=917 RepID=A0A1H8C4R3_9PROT|nr:hypothetical protein [Nitrosomonas marina]SEM89952.1 transmembrane sensor [Nitrosomonas marina]
MIASSATKTQILSFHTVWVETRNGTIVALGTRFIVELSDNTTTLTMLESEAAVHLAESDFTQSGATTITQTLNAGQQVTFSNGWIGDIETIDIRGISDAWKFRHLVVSNIPLPDVLDQLSRYRSGFIRYNRQKLEKMTVSAVLPVDDTDKALHLLTKSFPIQTHTITPWLVVVEPKAK